jgi:AraC-like DNA-binding protein
MDVRVQVILALIERDLRCVPKPNDLARIVRLSPSQFNFIFRAETGSSPAHYLKMLRMERAKVLLGSTFLSIKEIMTAVGLTDLSHFVREFKSNFGMTPSQFRKAHTNPTLITKILGTPRPND